MAVTWLGWYREPKRSILRGEPAQGHHQIRETLLSHDVGRLLEQSCNQSHRSLIYVSVGHLLLFQIEECAR